MTRNELYAIMQYSRESTFDENLNLWRKFIKNYSEGDQKIAEIKQKFFVIKNYSSNKKC